MAGALASSRLAESWRGFPAPTPDARRLTARKRSAYVRFQDREFALEEEGYTAAKRLQEVGAGYFEQVMLSVSGGEAATMALAGSTESAQFS
ncbi:MAG: hypothetical protein BZY81_04190 [SAR202 cluster bacterium Io17-Chloro-G4]|nr:MAG: hypothetical protein BZY81_04190 [SAR202 cluster bacterium Io17-Chloro-G4]